MTTKFLSFVILSFIINFGINEVSACGTSEKLQKHALEELKHSKFKDNTKIVKVPKKRVSGLQSHGLEHPEISWGYVDSPKTYPPSEWSKHYPTCGGSSQSPISIKRNKKQKSKKWSNPLKIRSPAGGDKLHGVLQNDGHAFGVKITGQSTNIKITGGPLKQQTYSLKQFHFHFSCNRQSAASEHTKPGHKYSGEVHFVFYNDKYSSFESAVDKSDGLVVLGLFIKIGNHHNKGITSLNKLIHNITNAHSSVEVGTSMSIYDFIGRGWGKDFSYAYYKGSLTTPPCYESVTWIVAKDAIKVRWTDIEPWTRLKGDKVSLICNNNRPLQNLNQREIHFVNDD